MNQELIAKVLDKAQSIYNAGARGEGLSYDKGIEIIDLCQPQGISVNIELRNAYMDLLNAVIEYRDYEHSGDPWEEDSRAMGEMMIDDMKRDGRLDKYIKIGESLSKGD